jgi:hypothetical protein
MTFYSKITVQIYLIFYALFVLQVSHRPAELKFIAIKLLPVETIPLQTSHFTGFRIPLPVPEFTNSINGDFLSLQWFTKLTVPHELTDFYEYPG